MARILQMSDLHLEFSEYYPTQDADILILGGDILVADYLTKSPASKYFPIAERFRVFFKHCMEKYEHIIYIAGNHEHYTGRFDKTISTLKNEFGSVHILDNSYIDIGDTRFVGSTLWTDFNRQNPLTMMMIKDYMADYKIIKKKDKDIYRKLLPKDTLIEHFLALPSISDACLDHDKVVVVTHHGPTMESIDPIFRNEFHGNGGYCSDLSEFILERPQIKLWTHGHVHTRKDYMVGTTRIFCNPRGYTNASGTMMEQTGFSEEIINV